MALPRCRPVLAAAVLATGLLVVPVASAPTASAAPCIELIPGVPLCLLPPAAEPVAIQGEAKVGKEVRLVAEPQWDQPNVVNEFQWLRDGEAIPEATESKYKLTGDDFGSQVSLRVTGQGSGPLPGTTDSNFVEPAKGDPIKATTDPRVTGSPEVGDTLTTTDGQWGEPEPKFTYQWYRSRFNGNGAELIQGATNKTYSPVAGDSGRAIVALVTADRVGFEKGAAVSNPVRVPKTTSTTRLSLVRATVKRTQAPSVRVALASGIGLVPRGVVTVFDGARRVRSFTLAAAANGAATFQLPRFTVGRHQLTVRYRGDTAHQASVSNTAVLKVTR